jgi:hypothetical protein
MARKLTHITNKLTAFVTANYGKRKICKDYIKSENGNLQIPDNLLVAFTVGRAELESNFYQYLIQKNFNHPISQARLYKPLIKNHANFQELIEKAKILPYFTIANPKTKKETKDYQNACFACYCIIIAISKNQKDPLSETLTYGYYKHYMPTLFPSKSTIKDTQLLAKEISKNLNQKWQVKTTIKESYKIQQDQVEFRLLAIIPNQKGIELIRLTGDRLNAIRLESYQTLLMHLQSNYYNLDFPTNLK